MPVIRCSVTKEGKLIPTSVEFEPGDRIHFKSDKPVHLKGHRSPDIEVKLAVNLNEIVAGQATGGGLNLDFARPATGLRNPPPPPPGIVPITIYVNPGQAQAAGAQQAAGNS
jgi:hypothetical protein